MNKNKGIISLFTLIVGILVAIGATFLITTGALQTNTTPWLSVRHSPTPPATVACAQDTKQCSDGSYVSRTGPQCDFALCPGEAIVTPSPYAQCKADADCPNSNYTCEATQGYGTVSPGNAAGGNFQIISGECKLKLGNACVQNVDCAVGICHAGICTNPIGKSCSGASDTNSSCPSGYECIQSCGPPVLRRNDPSPPYICQLIGYPRVCPICLASNTMISTPNGDINVKDLRAGIPVWSADAQGKKIITTIIRVSRALVPSDHKVIHLVLADSRELWVSPQHPTANGLTVNDLRTGDVYDGSRVTAAELIPYWDTYTYDLLPASATGSYWANGILMGSTLKQ